MKYGNFDDSRREYVIDTPYTPLPWINYLGNENFFGLISNTGGGYDFYRDAKLRRITRYRYNNVPSDNGGRLYYIKDGGTVWSPAFLPAKTELDAYKCRHGLGYTVFESAKNDLAAELTCFVPLGDNCEINILNLKNNSDKPKTITLTAALEWCLWNADDDSRNFQRNYSTGEQEVGRGVIYHKTEYRERRDHYAFFAHNAPENSGFSTDRDTFLGKFNDYDKPQAVLNDNPSNEISHGWAPIAAHHITVELAPGASRAVIFTLGYVELDPADKWEKPGVINKKPAAELLARYDGEQKARTAFDALKSWWDKILEKFQVCSGDEKLDRMVNIWNQYQCMITFCMSRSASYYESGVGRGMGFRDSCQDLLGFVHIIPERARERILDIAAIQLEDGSAWHQYQPLTKRGNADIGGGFNDDPLWLVACTYAYIAETGDASILDVPTQFNNEEGSEKPLFEHLRRSVNFTVNNKGPHGLPLIGRADWNDCLNLNCFSVEPGESFQTSSNFESGKAESVFIGGQFVLYAEQYAQICDKYGDPEEAKKVRAEAKKVADAVATAGWDGEWFRRAYDAFEQPVGSNENAEGKIYIEPQGMCVMAGIGLDDGKAKRALESVKEKLTGQYGTSLLWPCYSVYDKKLGEVSSYPPGYKENGGIFCHNNPWISIAYALAGDSEEAFNVYRRTCPAYVEDISEVRKVEPYVYCQMVGGQEAPTPGEGKNSWLTGTAAWTFVNVSQYLLGIRPTLDGLEIKPALPKSFGEVKVTRAYRGKVYEIVLNGEKYKIKEQQQ